MSNIEQPTLMPVARVTDAWSVLPSWLPVPGAGVLPVNAFLLKGAEPMLVDTGLGALSDGVVERLAEEIDLDDLRWIWLSHTDADHIGNLDRILALAPGAEVVTSFLGAGKMGMLGTGDPERFRLLEPGEALEVGGRTIHQVKPPYYDAPETIGFFDASDRVLFAADAFGALLPETVETIDEVPAATLNEGLVGWSSIDAPWLAHMDREALGTMLAGLEDLDPAHLLSGHLPPARGIDDLTAVLRAAYGRGPSAAVTPENIVQVEAALA